MTRRGRDGFIETEEVGCQCGGSMDFAPLYQGQSPPPWMWSDELDVFGRYLVLYCEQTGHLDNEFLLA